MLVFSDIRVLMQGALRVAGSPVAVAPSGGETQATQSFTLDARILSLPSLFPSTNVRVL